MQESVLVWWNAGLWLVSCPYMEVSNVPRGTRWSYLVAFSRTERVRKLIHMPSLCPRIHSRIPAEHTTCLHTFTERRWSCSLWMVCWHRRERSDFAFPFTWTFCIISIAVVRDWCVCSRELGRASRMQTGVSGCGQSIGHGGGRGLSIYKNMI